MTRTLALLVLLAACGDHSTNDPPDMAAPDGGPEGVADPIAPALPDLGPCPDGWSTRTIGGVDVCDPGEPIDCPEGQARFHGTAACAPVGRACPVGEFADDLPASGVLFVAPGGSGDGSRAAPFGSIRNAMSGAAPGTIVALAKGRYPERVTMRPGVTLRGACAAETVLEQPAMASLSNMAIRSSVADAAVADLSIVDVSGAGVVVDDGTLRLEGVVVDSATSYGVLVGGGSLTVDQLLVIGTRADSSGAAGFGIAVQGAVAVIEDVVVERNQVFGLTVVGASNVTARRLVARAQVPSADTSTGIAVEGPATLDAEDVFIEEARSVAVGVSAGGVATFDGLVVRNVRADGERMGFALAGIGEADVTVRRGWLTDAQGTAVNMIGRGRVLLEDTVIDEVVAPPATPGWGLGAAVQDLGTLSLERVLVHRAQAASLAAVGTSATELGDLLLEARDVTLLDSRSDALAGLGAYLVRNAEVAMERVRIERTSHAAIVLGEGVRLDATDLDVRESMPAADGYWGRALEAIFADVTLTRARFDTQHEVALIFSRTHATLTDVQILRTQERACAEGACSDRPGGIGLGAYDESAVTLDRFLIEDTPLCGVQLARSAQVDLSSGTVRDATIGACVQVPGYDVERLARDVEYVETATRIELTDHYVPDVGDPLD
ncbi:MAG: hypothetical protein JJ863_15305 [Deltaproteobacteria bacterium]|nr:hypothetical protein [Deltaproteobacteria bacterium]